MKLMQSVLLCFFVLIPIIGLSQIDSLQRVLVHVSEEERPVILRQIGIEYIKRGYADSSLMYLETAKDLAEKFQKMDVIASCHNNLGVAHYRLGNYAIAVSYYKSAIKLHAEMGTAYLAEQSKLNLGFAYKKLGLLDQAVKYLQEAVIYCEENGSLEDFARACSSLGTVHRELQNFEQALEFNQKALQVRLELGDTLKASYSYHNLGMTYYDLGEYDDAKTSFQTALRLKQKFGAVPQSIANTYARLGAVALHEGFEGDAGNHFRKSLQLRGTVEDKEGIASSYHDLAGLMVRRQHFDSAKWFVDTGFAIASEIQAAKLLLDISELQKSIALKQKDFESAFNWSDSILTYTHAYLGEQNRKAIAKQNARYELYEYGKKLEGEIEKSASLTVKNDRLETTNLWLWASIALVASVAAALVLLFRQIRKQKSEIETLHSEFQHRTMNYLQMLRAIFTLHIKATEDRELRGMLKQYRSRVDAMSSVHKYLSSATAKTIRLDQYLGYTVSALVKAFDKPNHKVELITNFSEITIDYDIAMKLGLIVNELVTNSMKYGLPTAVQPKLKVEAKKVEMGRLLLRVVDNGTGKTVQNGDSVTGTSLGTRLIALHAKSLKAVLRVDDSAGYETILEVPIQ